MQHRTVLGSASEYFRSRIIRWERDPSSHQELDGKLVLVEECEKQELDGGRALVRVMYDDATPPGLSAPELAQVRVGRP